MDKLLSLVTPLYETKDFYLNEIFLELKKFEKNVEWILINDSPWDEELKKLLSDLEKEEFIKIFYNKENLGIYKSYERGFLHAKGEYIGILDHDDNIELEKLLDFMKRDKTNDIIYTNEYKFIENKKFDYYKKPSLDYLSIVFYYYTHHITLWKNFEIKKVLSREKDKYTSIFDLSFMVDYIYNSEQKLKTQKLDLYSYGWRVHKNSTANSLEQKPLGLIERVKKVRDFFTLYNDDGVFKLNDRHKFIVEGKFFSFFKKYDIPLIYDSDKIKEIIQNNKNLNLINIDKIKDKFLEDLYFRLYYIPINYLLENFKTNIFIPLSSEQKKYNDNENFFLHINQVPFLLEDTIENIYSKKIKGMMILNENVKENEKISVFIRKE